MQQNAGVSYELTLSEKRWYRQQQDLYDHVIKLTEKYNNATSNNYKNKLLEELLEHMPLDNHLFSDVKEALARNMGCALLLP
jgi:hypothetical protein